MTTAAAGSAVTIGKYDAIHVGHQEIFARLVRQAETHGLTSVVLTFEGHPNAILDPTHVPLPILGPKLRAEYIAATGVDATYTLDFDLPLAEIVFDFFDQLKSRTKGYASLDYEDKGNLPGNLVKVDILLNAETVDAFSAIVHRDKAYAYGVMMTGK